MINTFEIIARGFAAHVLVGGLTGNPVKDAATSLTMSHLLKKGTKSRLTGWAIIKESGSLCQADIAAEGVRGGDARTRFEAFAGELENFSEPAVFLTFTQSTVNIGNVFATYDPRVTRICEPDRCDTFNVTEKPSKEAVVAHRKIHALIQKRKGI